MRGSISLWLQSQMVCVCELGRPLGVRPVCTYTCSCAKENVQPTLCAQTRPAGGPPLRRDAKSFLVSKLASATLRSLALPSLSPRPFTYLYPPPHPLMSQQQYTPPPPPPSPLAAERKKTPQRCTWLSARHAQPNEHVERGRGSHSC